MNFSAITVYLGIIFFFLVVVLFDYQDVTRAFWDIFDYKDIFVISNITPLFTVAATIFAYFSILIVSFGDFSRYVKNESELKKAKVSAWSKFLFSILATFIVVGLNLIKNKNLENMERILTNPTDIIGKFDNILLNSIALIFIIFASGSTNLIANYIPAQNSLLNFIPNKLNLNSSGIIIIILGSLIGIFWLPLLSQIGILSFVDTFASFFGPLFGIIVVDYYLIKKTKLVNKDIEYLNDGTYYYSKWNGN